MPTKYKPTTKKRLHYTIKDVDRNVWGHFKTKCEKDGRKMRFVLVTMITAYANGEYRIQT